MRQFEFARSKCRRKLRSDLARLFLQSKDWKLYSVAIGPQKYQDLLGRLVFLEQSSCSGHDPFGNGDARSSRLRQKQVQMLEAKSGPGFVSGKFSHCFGHRNELRADNAAATACHTLIGNLHNMHDSKMDLPDVRAVIVDDRDSGF